MKNQITLVLLLLAVVPGCSREDAHTAAKPAAATARPGLVTVAPKPEPVAAGKRRVLELEGGVRVEVIAEGEGEIVGPGDEVALSMTLTYMPKSPEELKADAAKAEEAAKVAEKQDAEKSEAGKKDTGKKDGSKKSKPKPAKDEVEPAKTEARPADAAAVDAAKPADEGAKTLPPLISESAVSPTHGAKPETAPTSEPAAKPDAGVATETATETKAQAQAEPAAPGEKPAADAAPAAADSKPADAATPTAADATAPAEGTAPAPAPLAAALEPVVVVSTKNSGMPIRARVGASGALLPGLSRALVGLRQGTVAEITLPAEAAYGAAGLPSAGIPPGTPLHATIEIREVKR